MDRGEIDSGDRKKGTVALHQHSLPELEEHDIVSYEENGVVRKDVNFPLAAAFSSADDDMDIPERELYDVLKNRKRTRIVQLIDRYSSDIVPRNQLEKDMAAIEKRERPQYLSSEQENKAKIPLYQTHLPRLEEEGIIDWDRDSDKIAEGENFHLASEYAGLDLISLEQVE